MTWQDIVLSIGQWMFIVALVPTILSKHKPSLISSILTTFVLLIFVVVFLSLNLWTSAASTGLLALTWLILAIQKYYQKKLERKQ